MKEAQRAYETFVSKGMEMIYAPQVMPKILKSMQDDPIQGLAHALTIVTTKLEDSGRRAGIEFGPDVRGHGGIELLARLVELAGPDGADFYAYSENEIGQALRLAAGNQSRRARPAAPSPIPNPGAQPARDLM